MRKWIFYVVGAFLSLLGACADGGTVDPNAFAANPSSATEDPRINVPTSSSSSDKVVQTISSTSVIISSPSVDITSSSDEKTLDSLTPAVSVESEVVKQYFAFTGKSEMSYTVREDATNSNSIVVNTAVYEAEKGAVSYCADEDKNYTLKIRIVPEEKDVKKLLILSNLGNGCEPVLNAFKTTCMSKSGAELQLIKACDSNGNLEVFCSYTDETANFDLLLDEYMQEVEGGCNSEYLDASLYLQGEW